MNDKTIFQPKPQSLQQCLEFDKKHIWHPYTSMVNPLPVYPVAKARGSEIILENGQTLIEGMSSWWCMIHGYNHPKICKAIETQLKKFSHVMFGGLTHKPAIELAKLLVEMTPKALEHLFFADSGSVAVEVAMKMSLQYYSALGFKQKKRFVTIRGGYHGDTWHAMSVCDPDTGMHCLYNGNLSHQLFLPRPLVKWGEPWNEQVLEPVKRLFEEKHQQIAAFILEPIVQGAGGLYFYHPQYLVEVRKLCNQFDILLITDEIATGFGRTGKLFAVQWAGVTPDILCVGKSLTGGMISLAAVLTTRKIAMGVSSGDLPFMHGPTFMANPLACCAAIASLELLNQGHWRTQVDAIAMQLERELSFLGKHPRVHEVRVLGAIGVVELKSPVIMDKIQSFFVSQGVWIRPFGRLIYLMPPFVIESHQLSQLTQAISLVLDENDCFEVYSEEKAE